MTNPVRLLASVLVLAVLAVPLAGCGRDDDGVRAITVFGAASLTDALTELGHAFEAANPDVRIEFSFAGSSSLREQILAGAPADVFASANEENMDLLVEVGAVRTPVDIASNRLAIVVPDGNPAGVRSLDDFADSSYLVGLCAVEVPCGDFARQAFARAGVEPAPDTEEPDVRSLLTKVAAGDLDAGIVYETDVRTADATVDGIEIPAAENVVVTYPIAVVTGSGDVTLAEEFVAFILSPEGFGILRRLGFGSP